MALGYACKWELASEYTQRAIVGCERLGDRVGVAIACGNLALLEIEKGDLGASEGWLAKAESSLSRARFQANGRMETREQVEILATRGNLENHRGRILAHQGNFDGAYRCFSNHLVLAEALESKRSIGVALGRIAWTDILQDSCTDRTVFALRRYMSLAISTFNPRAAANAHSWTGQHAIRQDAFVEATRHFRDELLLRRFLQDELGAVRAASWLQSTSRAAGGDDDTQRDWFSELRQIAERVSMGPMDEALVRYVLQVSSRHQGRTELIPLFGFQIDG